MIATQPAPIDEILPSAPSTDTPAAAVPPAIPIAGADHLPALMNPVIRPSHRSGYDGDFPDPSIVLVGSTYWAYATGSAGRNLSMMSSTDLRTWTDPIEALPVLPAWAAPGFTWAPAILPVQRGYLLYYTARVAATGRQCISVAFARTAEGPFIDASASPIICQAQSGGSIDPSPFVAPDGSRYLLWKSDDNALGAPARIGVQQLTADGTAVTGTGRRLLTATAAWQDGVIEGPTMGVVEGRYILFYGANHWETPAAGIGFAECDGPMGPCTNRSIDGPWMASMAGATGPSGPDLFRCREGLCMATHSRRGPGPTRSMSVSRIHLVRGSPVAETFT